MSTLGLFVIETTAGVARRCIPAVFVALLSIALLVATFFYDSYEKLTSLEANNLYTENAEAVCIQEDAALNVIDELGSNARLFIQSADSNAVRWLITNDYELTRFPIHKGTSFSNLPRNEALVGEELLRDHPADTYSYQGVEYSIVGTLGLGEHSLLENTVLLKRADWEKPDEGIALTCVFDGDYNHQRLADRTEENEPEKITDRSAYLSVIDIVSPFLKSAGIILAVLGIVISTLMATEARRSEFEVLHLAGVTYARLLVIQLLYLCLLSIVLVSLMLVIFNTLLPFFSPGKPTLFLAFAITQVSALFSQVLFFNRSRRSGNARIPI